MNISAHDDTWFKICRRKVKWVFLGILAPEFVAYVALQQCVEAFIFRKELNKLWNEHHKTEVSRYACTVMADIYIAPSRNQPTLRRQSSARLMLSTP